VPRTIPLETAVFKTLAGYFLTEDLSASLKLDLAHAGWNATRANNDYSAYYTRPGVTWDEWGRGRIWDSIGQYAEYLYPLERAETVDEILAYPWPDYGEEYRYAGLAERVQALQSRGFAVVGGLEETVFEIAWQLRSMERLFEDIHNQDEKAVVLLDQITERRAATARAYASAGVDILALGDDVAIQTGLLMSKKMYRQWFKPRLARVIQAARECSPTLKVQYHSDGKIDDLIPDLIEAGVEILNPLQPECVDHARVKQVYGGTLAFSGGLGVQSVLPFGTPAEVREHVRTVIASLGAGGGLIVGPSHVIERDVPLENILAMLQAIDDYGEYA
jgi:uroporphyrinogen decarboxylase